MKLKITLIIFLIAALVFLFIFSARNIKENNKGVREYNKGNYETASEILDAETALNNSSLVLLNSAGADYKKGDLEKAASKYDSVLNSTFSDKTDKFDASYGLGNIEYQNNNFQKAADFYKQALKINPYDNDAKHNLELSLRKLEEQQQQQEQSSEQSSENKDDKKDNKENKQQDKKDNKQGKDKQQQNQEKQDKGKQGKDKEQSSKEQNSKEQGSKEQSSKEQDSKQGSEQKQQNAQGAAQSAQADKKDGKEKSAVLLLNYYDEVDKNSDKLRNKTQKQLLNQPQEDW